MAILTTTNLGQSFGAFDLFSGISVSIPKDGKVGLVGPNGIGKTTFLLILAGQMAPSAGSIHMAKGTRFGYLRQEAAEAFSGRQHSVYDEMLLVFKQLRATETELHAMETAMSDPAISQSASDDLFERYSALQAQFELAGGYQYDLRIRQVLTGLGFDDQTWQLPLPHLSGGQKTRVLLARLLLEAPDLLILDEPTNHLDVQAIEWLEGTLKTWEGAVLIVSHDRYFLDKTVNTIWEMTPTDIQTYRGNYSAYVMQRDARWERRLEEFATLKERLEKEVDYIRRNMAGQRTQMAQGKLSRLSREVAAIRAGGLGVLGDLESKGWMQVKAEYGVEMQASTIGELHEQIKALQGPGRPAEVKMRIQASHRSGNLVLRTSSLQIGFPGALLFTADDIVLNRQERAALIGPNGAGKTTFLRTILGHQPPLAGQITPGASLEIGYFSQAHDNLNRDNTVLDELLAQQNMMLSEARSYLARYLFRGDDVYKPISLLSGGERGRLALALLALQKANFLLLDEPTNHLDIPAQETLQAALAEFEGTILMVTHDRYLVDRLATQIWELRDGRLRIYTGSYQEYLAQRSLETEAAREAAAQARAVITPASNGDDAPRLSKNEQRRRAEALAALERQVHELEARLHAISQTLQAATQAQSFDKIQSLSLEYAAVEEELAQRMSEWETLAHE
ncbi:MAG: ABC-F family ATP-binding cassette domain-containing protein [Chloroflexi bacterium]|nr:ABC-F family ATP-binding cassette domain-containing protein [Chloroflexota bacterium]